MSQEDDLTQETVNQETSKIAWSELQRFFAQGLAVFISSDLDLIEVADAFSKDNTQKVEYWMQQRCIYLVSDQQASHWIEANSQVWAVVIKPWILVQNI